MSRLDKRFRILAALAFGGIGWLLATPWIDSLLPAGTGLPWRLVPGAFLAAAIGTAVLAAGSVAHVWGRGFLAASILLLALPFGVSRLTDRALDTAVRGAGPGEGGPVLAFLTGFWPGVLQIVLAAIFGIGLGLVLLWVAVSLLRRPR